MSRKSVRLFLLFLLCEVALAIPATAKVIFVDASALGRNDGSSWSSAFRDLQSALAIAISGDEIWVAEGIYRPGIQPEDTFSVPLGVALYGGFAGGERDRTQAAPETQLTILSGDIDRNDTQAVTPGITESVADRKGINSHHLISIINTPPLSTDTVVIDGFTLTGGHANEGTRFNGGAVDAEYVALRLTRIVGKGNEGAFGGAIYSIYSNLEVVDSLFENNVANSAGALRATLGNTVLLQNSIFRSNQAAVSGGAVELQCQSNRVVSSLFEENEANIGGGLLMGDLLSNSGTLVDSEFRSNHANLRGGGLRVTLPDFTMVNTLVRGNRAGLDGGGMIFEAFDDTWDPAASLINSQISGNLAERNGGGILLDSSTEALEFDLIQCTLSGNAATVDGGGVLNRAAEIRFRNTILWDNAASGDLGTASATALAAPIGNAFPLHRFAHSVVANSRPNGSFDPAFGIDEGGNQSTDPLFTTPLDPLTAPAVGFLLTLQTRSPAADYGDNSFLPPDVIDLDGDGNTTEPLPLDLADQARLPNGVVDIGAFETFGSFPSAGDDSFRVFENLPSSLPVLGNDSEASGGDVLTIHLVDGPAAGTLSEGPASLSYTPPPDFFGITSFTYFVKDRNGLGSNLATVTITITDRANDPPSFDASNIRTGVGSGKLETFQWASNVFTDAGNYETGQQLKFTFAVISSDFDFVDLPTADANGELSFSTRSGSTGIALIEATLTDSGPGTPASSECFVITLDTPLLFHVDADATGAATGLNWIDAYPTLPQALAEVVEDDEIWVAEGIYHPGPGPDDVLSLVDGVDVYGGFVGDETTRTDRAPEVYATVLSGDLGGDDADTDGNGIAECADDIIGINSRRLIEARNVSASTILDGFILTAAQAIEPYPTTSGAGLYLENSSPFIRNCRFIGNEAENQGAAIYIADGCAPFLIGCEIVKNRSRSIGFAGIFVSDDNSSLAVRDSAFRENEATGFTSGVPIDLAIRSRGALLIEDSTFTDHPGDAVGIQSDGVSVAEARVLRSSFTRNSGTALSSNSSNQLLVQDCVFEENLSEDDGAALFLNNSTVQIFNCLFFDNRSSSGGAIYIRDSTIDLVNATIVRNVAVASGGGINIQLDSTVDISNTIIFDNRAFTNGVDHPTASLFASTQSPTKIRHSIVANSGGSAAWSSGNGAADGGGNLDLDPEFLFPEGKVFRLAIGSPALNSGLNAENPTGNDLNGDPRIANSVIDLGAYEGAAARTFTNFFPGLAPDGDLNGNGVTNFLDYAQGFHPADPDALPGTLLYQDRGKLFFRYTEWPDTEDAGGILQRSYDLDQWTPFGRREIVTSDSTVISPIQTEFIVEILPSALPPGEDNFFIRRLIE